MREVSGPRTQQNVPGPGIKPELLNLEVTALIMRPLHLFDGGGGGGERSNS